MQVISTVTAAASTYDLTDLTSVKEELSIGLDNPNTKDDGYLGRLITRASKDVASECGGRVFPVESVTEDFFVETCGYGYGAVSLVLSSAGILAKPGEDSSILQLCRYPIAAVSSVVLVSDINDSTALVQDTDFKIDAKKGWLLRTDSTTTALIPWEWTRITVQYDAGFGSDVAETFTIPASPHQVTTLANAASFSINKGVTFVSGGAALTKIASGTPATGQYLVAVTFNADGTRTVTYTFAAADAGKQVSISYGYNSIPEDLAGIAIELVTDKYRARGRERRLMEENSQGPAGTQRFWVGAMGDGPFPPEIMKRLERYTIPSFA